jgi:hypothetical protein
VRVGIRKGKLDLQILPPDPPRIGGKKTPLLTAS